MTPPLKVYKTLPLWNRDSFPKNFQTQHNTAEGTWAQLHIVSGQLRYSALDAEGKVLASTVFSKDNPPPLVEPQAWHKVEPLPGEDFACYLEFLCLPEAYYQKKYGVAKPHADVETLMKYLADTNAQRSTTALKALDLGSGKGRNSFFLHSQGFQVKAIDANAQSIQKIQKMIDAENLQTEMQARCENIEDLTFTGRFDLVISTVVFQFLKPACIPAIIERMQQLTRPGGLHLIVAPMSTPEFPCPLPFAFTFKSQELAQYYARWKIHAYTEEPGHFHRKDPQGKPYAAQFATLIAQRPRQKSEA